MIDEEFGNITLKKKRKLKKWVYFLFIIPILVIGLIGYKIYSNKMEEKKINDEQALIKKINSHYDTYVSPNKETSLYILDNDSYQEIGKVYPNTLLSLDEIIINAKTEYFKIKDSDYYLKYEDVLPRDKPKENDRYKKYLLFNENIITKDSFTLYLDDDKAFSFNKSMEFPIIINNYNDKYYVEYNNSLLNISKEDIEKTVKSDNTTKKNQSKITTLCYHRIYDTNDKCTDPYLCLSKNDFDTQMKYLSDNNYLTLTLNELYLYLQGKLQVEKTVVITMDDGYLYKAADEVLHKYDLNGTLFVITGDFADFASFKELTNLDIQSHTNNLHRNYVCSGGNQGGAILCAGEAKIKEDLASSNQKLGVEPIGLAFPFYDYNDSAIKAVKASGYKMAFIGRAGKMGKSTPNKTDLYKIPRMTVYDSKKMSFNEWKGYL